MKRLTLVVVLTSAVLSGCVQIPRENLSRDISTQELSDHVHFLAQPALKGRSPRTRGSKYARRYLKERFEAYGLVPWGTSRKYEQSFRFGVNVIGVIPGTDEKLANELVLVCAHYDHGGKDKEGCVLPGACDNASGVAAMLEIAERLSLREARPRRSVCFAAFDCEEMFLLGSMAFTCREDFDKDRIVAVVNIDMLGRDAFDVVKKALFVTGTEGRPGLRRDVLEAAKDAGVRMLPVGNDALGPRGDHVAFLDTQGPVLMFNCGENGDYHRPTDTADRLDYEKMERALRVIGPTVEALADADRIEARIAPETGDLAELRAIKTVLDEIADNYEKVGLTAENVKPVADLRDRAGELLEGGKYTRKVRYDFFWDVMTIAEPILDVMAASDDEQPSKKTPTLHMMAIAAFSSHAPAMVELYRRLLRKALLALRNPFLSAVTVEDGMCDIADDAIYFELQEDGQYRLSALMEGLSLRVEVNKRFSWYPLITSIDLNYHILDIVGSREDATDYCLLLWQHYAGKPFYDEVLCRIFEAVRGPSGEQDRDAWLNRRLSETGCANEVDWAVGLIERSNPDVKRVAVTALPRIAPDKADEILAELARRTDVHPSVRARAISMLSKNVETAGLLMLVDMLNDQTPSHKNEHRAISNSVCPHYGHPHLRETRKSFEEWVQKQAKSPETIATTAEKKLKELTGQDFGSDCEAWRNWIEQQEPM